MAIVLLVDGVGTGCTYDRQRDVLTIILPKSRQTFVKARETFDGMEVYRLKDYSPAPIRSVNKYALRE